MADSSPFEASGGSSYSIKQQFDNATVFITGASGYLGSLLVEQLLRTTNVKRIYVLFRGKKNQPAQERLQRILYSGLFHMVRDDVKLLSKVVMLEGDLNSDSLGLSPANLARVQAEVEFVMHSAASIELEADVQHTLESNYVGTHRLLMLATKMQRLRCFCHLSTAYTNINHPRGSYIEERIYPLKLGQQRPNHADLVEDLLSLDKRSANVRAQMFLDCWDFPNTYTLGKHLTEELVADFHKEGRLPVVIVRPTLVCGLSGAPYPGYCGNLAGPIGMGVAMAIGLFDSLDSVAMVPTHVWDSVPGDMVTSVVLAASAAMAAGVRINEYKDSSIGSNDDPMIFHAGTSTTYPISFVEASWASTTVVKNNPPPFKLPGTRMFTVPLDFRPDEKAVERCKYWTAWKVYIAVKFLETVGQHKTARRLKYGHMAWAIQNSGKTDRHLFFGSKNLIKLAEQLDASDQATGEYTVTWTIKNGGWPRYIHTNIAGMYRQVFGMSDLKGLAANDFKFIPAKPLDEAASCVGAAPAGEGESKPLLSATGVEGAPAAASYRNASSDDGDVIEAGLKSTASLFASIPASGASLQGLARRLTTTGHDFMPPVSPANMELSTSSAGEGGLFKTRSANVGARSVAAGNSNKHLGGTMSYQPQVGSDVAPVRDAATKKNT